MKEEEEYLVKWKVELDAGSPLEAAVRAREMQLNPESTAIFFEVEGEGQKFSEIELPPFDQAERPYVTVEMVEVFEELIEYVSKLFITVPQLVAARLMLSSMKRGLAAQRFPMSDWRDEVVAQETVLGYQDWLNGKVET